jgi:site-specific DNA-methyltransferase (adenine-specific)
MTKTDFETGTFYLGDCFDVMRSLPDGCVDMVLCDLPYGTTQNKWDSVLPLEPLWREYWRLCRGAVVLTAAQPFTSALVMSQIDRFKYDWVWRKNRATNVFNAKKQPLRDKEDVLVFCNGTPPYFPQGLVYSPEPSRNGKKDSENWGTGKTKTYQKEWGNYPKQVLEFDSVQRVIHPTQKPVALFEYLVRTYTDEGMTVLDNTAGSGTTAIAAINANRRWICIERDPDYYTKAVARVEERSNRQELF